MSDDQSYEDKIVDIRVRLKRLDNLLTDPHPGLLTWSMAYQNAVDALILILAEVLGVIEELV